jgi:hypothetical protein
VICDHAGNVIPADNRVYKRILSATTRMIGIAEKFPRTVIGCAMTLTENAKTPAPPRLLIWNQKSLPLPW